MIVRRQFVNFVCVLATFIFTQVVCDDVKCRVATDSDNCEQCHELNKGHFECCKQKCGDLMEDKRTDQFWKRSATDNFWKRMDDMDDSELQDIWDVEDDKRGGMRNFLGKRGGMRNFLGKRGGMRNFLGKRDDDEEDVDDINAYPAYPGYKRGRLQFLGKRAKYFLGKREDEDDEDEEKRAKYFLGKRAKYFLGKREDDAEDLLKRARYFLGKREDTDLTRDAEAKRQRYFLGKRAEW